MKLFLFALASMVLVATEAATNFRSTCNTANNQMASLSQYISNVKAVAVKNRHYAISAKCDEASQHLTVARNSWNSVSNSFGGFPWEARTSPHSTRCQSRLSSCGSTIDWINNQPEVRREPAYRVHLNNCRNTHRSCQSTCGQVWNWPTPPGYRPKPSGYYRRQRREETPTLCPVNEIACPIIANATGHECIDVKSEITSCGGCVTSNEGENCLAIEGVDEVGCEVGTCRVFSALPGYEISELTGRPILFNLEGQVA